MRGQVFVPGVSAGRPAGRRTRIRRGALRRTDGGRRLNLRVRIPRGSYGGPARLL